MASAPSEPRRVLGRIDASGCLVFADPELELLQRDAGARLGEPLALPQVAAIAQLARKLRTTVSRPAIAASSQSDVELWVRATPQGDEILLSLEGWTERPPAPPRLAALLGGGTVEDAGGARNEWAADEELRIISLSGDLAELIGVSPDEAAGQPLTRLVRLDEDEAGEMPLISALAARRGFSGQRARSRSGNGRSIVISGEVVSGADGRFAGFRGWVQADGPVPAVAPVSPIPFDLALDDVLRSPLDRIIESAERIVERADGPLRSDYASYGNDIATAAKHLLSVVTSMSEDAGTASGSVDLHALASEAVVMLDGDAQERKTTIAVEAFGTLRARGEARSVIQILVNLIGNAIRYSPKGGRISVRFSHRGAFVALSVQDSGPGVAEADRQRIFERFERAHAEQSGTGLGLAISRRLARSMGGDVTLDSAPGEGARFTLALPAA